MKITIDIDCSAQEARAFFGLPDVSPAQKAFVEALRTKMTESIAGMDSEAMFKAWMPDGMPGLDQWRDMWGGGGQEKVNLKPAACR